MARIYILFLLVVGALCCGLRGTVGTSLDHIVGGRSGWRLPPNASFYQEWAQNKTFVVGDKLVFMYTPSLENVLEVSEKDFNECTQENVVDMYYAGPTVLEISKPGAHYYYSGVGMHCEGGQKLSINVSATAVPDPARDGVSASPTVVDSGTPPEVVDHLNNKSSAGENHRAGVIAGLLLPLSFWLNV